MKIKDLLKKLRASPQYDSFSSAYKDAFPVAGFFVLDNENKKNLYQIDYLIPSKNKIAAFSIDHPVNMQMLDAQHNKEPLKELDMNAVIDLDAIEGIVDDEMKNRNITESIKKIIAVFHMHEGKRLWNLNCMLSGMSLLRAHVDDESQTVLKMEKVNLFDVMKTMPGVKQQMASQGVQNAQVQPSQAGQSAQELITPKKPIDKKQAIKNELQKLDTLEAAITKEKAILEKELSKGSKAKLAKEDKKGKKK